MRLVLFLLTSISLSVNYISTSAQKQDTTFNATRSFFEKGNITGNVSYQLGRISDLKKDANGYLNYNEPVFKMRNSLVLSLGVRIVELVYFRPSFYVNLNPNINVPWATTDYTYALERTCYDNNSFSYGYVNYEINKYKSSSQSLIKSFQRGSFYVRYFNSIPTNWMHKIGIDSAVINYSLSIRYAVRYLNGQNEIEGEWLSGKTVLSAGLRYTFFRFMYLEGAVNYYPLTSTKMNWDPDFTYGFGVNKYGHMTVGVSYGNYSTNRFPWNKKEISNYGFLDGIFSILLNIRL